MQSKMILAIAGVSTVVFVIFTLNGIHAATDPTVNETEVRQNMTATLDESKAIVEENQTAVHDVAGVDLAFRVVFQSMLLGYDSGRHYPTYISNLFGVLFTFVSLRAYYDIMEWRRRR